MVGEDRGEQYHLRPAQLSANSRQTENQGKIDKVPSAHPAA
jgi:hypothetical protein